MFAKPHRPTPQGNFVVLPTDEDHLEAVIEAYNIGYGVPHTYYNHPDALNIDKLANHLRVFPQGQFMAYDIDTERVVGMCTSMIVDFDPDRPLLESWRRTTGDGTLNTHRPDGKWLYGVDCVVLREHRGQGVGGKLIKARTAALRKLNLRGMVAGSVPIDYHIAAAAGVSIEDYVADVVAGRRWDTNLSKQLKKGFRVHNIIPNYIMDYPKTLNYAVAIVWDNLNYRAPKALPARRTAAQPLRQRKHR